MYPTAAHSGLDRSKKNSKRYISVREHFHDDHKMLNFGCDEFIDNVVQCPGKLWHGKHRGKKGLFVFLWFLLLRNDKLLIGLVAQKFG